MSKIEKRVISKLDTRAEMGKKKYGTTMERNDLSLQEWLQHLQEELMDATIYIEKIMQEVQYQEYELNNLDPDVAEYNHNMAREAQAQEEFAKEEAREERMKIIGQNGNDGLHYADAAGNYWENGAETYAEEMIAKSDARKDELSNLSNKININNPDNVTSTRSLYPGDIDVTYEIQEKKRK